MNAQTLVFNALRLERWLQKHEDGHGRQPLRAVLGLHVLEFGEPTAGVLASLLCITSGATTRVLGELEKAGWAKRVHDPTDLRIIRVQLTDAGHEKARAVLRDVEQHL